MLYQKNTGKLQPRWRGPFRINGLGGSHRISYQLRQINGRLIRGIFHGNHSRSFVPRTGYLRGSSDGYPMEQTIRAPKKKRK